MVGSVPYAGLCDDYGDTPSLRGWSGRSSFVLALTGIVVAIVVATLCLIAEAVEPTHGSLGPALIAVIVLILGTLVLVG